MPHRNMEINSSYFRYSDFAICLSMTFYNTVLSYASLLCKVFRSSFRKAFPGATGEQCPFAEDDQYTIRGSITAYKMSTKRFINTQENAIRIVNPSTGFASRDRIDWTT